MIAYVLRLALAGKFRRIFDAIHRRAFIAWHSFLWQLITSRFHPYPGKIEVRFSDPIHSIAHNSPDHLHPKGAANDNNTNRAFVKKMRDYCHSFRVLDLGCAGGQMVMDFAETGWISVGIEGSNVALRRANINWRLHGNQNLFTGDITKRFQVQRNGGPMLFSLITAWEVLEHIAERDLPEVFRNIVAHLAPGGLFIATTTETSDMNEGVELHQTQFTNQMWHDWIARECPQLERKWEFLKPHHCVRWNFDHPSLLTYRKRL